MKSIAMGFLISTVSIVVLAGCSGRTNHSPIPTISDKTRADLSAPVNCSTAQQDIAVLEEERASVGKQILSGVRSILPISAVAGLLMGDYSDRIEVMSGQYNDDIAAKVADIKMTCGIA